MRRTVIRVVAAAFTLSAGMLCGSGAVPAHDPGYSVSCDGARLMGTGYEESHTNEAAIYIDGVEAFHVVDFGTSFDETVPVPQDAAVHSVRFVIDAQGPGTEGHPEYDIDVTDSVGPCGEGTTTTSSTTTTTSTPDTTTTTTPETTTTTPESSTTSPESSTTSPGSTTSTTDPGGLSIAAFAPVCVRDAPYIHVTFGDQPEFNGHTATVTFIDLDGNVVGTETATYQAGATVRFVYPGAIVDASGNPVDWPGWVWDGDEWVPDPTDDRLRDGLTVKVEVNPTATGTVSYPPATPDCDASPPGPPSSTLPATGTGSSRMTLIAAALVVIGLGLVALTRLRAVRK